MALSDADVISVLDEILPARFGGQAGDYQLLEGEAEAGQPRLSLLVHPNVGELDAREVVDVFLSAIGKGSGVERLTELLWHDTALVVVERTPPHIMASGKVLHVAARGAARAGSNG